MLVPFLYGQDAAASPAEYLPEYQAAIFPVSTARAAEIENISLQLYDKMSNPGTLSNVLFIINAWRDVPLFKNPWIQGGIPCSQDNIKKVLTAYFYFLDSNQIQGFNPFDKNYSASNAATVSKIAAAISNQLTIETTPPNYSAFVYFIMVNYQGWNKDNYNPETWGAEKAAQHSELFNNWISDVKSEIKTGAAVVVGAWTLKQVLPVIAAAAAVYILGSAKARK
jgi:hypothetical protein